MFFQVVALALLCSSVRSQNSASSYSINSDGSTSVAGKFGLAGTDSNLLSVLGSKSSTGVISKGLALDNINGHGLSVTHTKIPGFGDQLTGAGRLNLLNSAHKLDANAFVTRNMPKIPDVPNFNTVGGNLDYMYKNRVGATLGAAHTPFLQRTDYSAMGKLNLFHSPSSSVDLNAGVSKFVSPHFNTNWQPAGGITFSKFW